MEKLKLYLRKGSGLVSSLLAKDSKESEPQMASGDRNSTTSAGLLSEYKKKYPSHQLYDIADVKECTKSELRKYTSTQENPNDIEVIYYNFLQHLLVYQSMLDNRAKSIYSDHALGSTQKLYEDFNKSSPLKEYISEEIKWSIEDQPNSYHSNDHWKELFSSGEAGIQTILEPSSFDSQNLKAWDPVHLTLSYELFCLVINDLIMQSKEYEDKMILRKKKRHEGTYKRSYILYMNTVAKSDMEFLLAVVSAFGINPSQYPSKLLLIMLKRKILCSYYSELVNITEQDLNEASSFDSALSLGNSLENESQSLSTKSEAKLALTPKSISHSSTPVATVTAAQVVTPPVTITAPTKPLATKPIATIPVATKSLANIPLATKPLATIPVATKLLATIPLATKSITNLTTISADEFIEHGRAVWNQFYGKSNSKAIPLSWYQAFAREIQIANNTNNELSICLKQLLLDQEKTKNFSNWKICGLLDLFPDKLSSIETNLQGVKGKSPKSFLQNDVVGYNELMRMENSYLQAAMIDPVSGKIKIRDVPHPTDWCPSNCVIPFHGFHRHIKWQLEEEQKVHLLESVDIDIVRLRYVEYIFNTQNSRQFALGLLTAYGPNILQYPLRVLRLLKAIGFLRPTTLLFSMVDGWTTENPYCDILLPRHGLKTDIIISNPSPSLQMVKTQPQTHTQQNTLTRLTPTRPSTPAVTVKAAQVVTSAVSTTVPTKPLATKSTSKLKTISADEFIEHGREIWNQFYGKSNPHAAILKWYEAFAGEIQQADGTDDVLSACIEQLLLDQENTRNLSNWKIEGLVDIFPDKLLSIEENLYGGNEKSNGCFLQEDVIGYNQFMRKKQSFLQAALVDPGVEKGNSKQVPQPIDWCPSNCLLPFHGFQRHVKWRVSQGQNISPLESLDMDIMRLRYVEYMLFTQQKRQVALGLLTAYGPNILQYPLSVLRLLKNTGFLRTTTLLFSVIGGKTNGIIDKTYSNILLYNNGVAADKIISNTSPSIAMVETQPLVSSIVSTTSGKSKTSSIKSENTSRTSHSASPSYVSVAPSSSVPTKIVAPSYVPPKIVPPSSVSTNIVAPSSVPTTIVAPSSSIPTSIVAPSSSIPTKIVAPFISTTLHSSNLITQTISEFEFLTAAMECWRSYYSSYASKQIPKEWYTNFASQFPIPNDENGILTECIEQLVRDKETRQHPTYKIIGIEDNEKFRVKLGAIQKEMLSLELLNPLPVSVPSKRDENQAYFMGNNKSFLQLALVDEVISGSKNSHSIPKIDEWCPSGSIFPFHGFQCHANWYLAQKGKLVRFEEVDLEVMRVRYVEYLNILYQHQHPRQFFLGLLTAYGPNLLNYPLRVLIILKKRDLLKPNTILYELVDMCADRNQKYSSGILYYTNSCPSTLPKDSLNSRLDADTIHQENGPIGTPPLIENKPTTVQTNHHLTNQPPSIVTKPDVQLIERDVEIDHSCLPTETKKKKKKKKKGNNPIEYEFDSSSPIPQTEAKTTIGTSINNDKLGQTVTREVEPEPSFSGKQSTTAIRQSMEHKPTTTNPTFDSEDFTKWKKACEELFNQYGNHDSSDFQIPLQFYSEVYAGYDQYRKAINSSKDQDVFHLFIHGALSGIQLIELQKKSGYCTDTAVARAFESTIPINSEGFALDEGTRLLLSQFVPDTKIYTLLRSFIDTKRLEEGIIEKILENYPGDKLQEFVRELSYHACFITNEEDIRLCTTLLRDFIGKDLISKAHVIHCFKTGVIVKLPEVVVKVVQAAVRLAEFLTGIFYEENDFCWFLTLTGDLSQTYLPVWAHLLQTTTSSLKRRISEEKLVKILKRTPGAQSFPKYLNI